MKSTQYKLQLKARSKEGSKHYSFGSTEGVEFPENILPEEVLMLQASDIENTSAILCIDSRVGVTGCVLGDKARAGRVMMTESNARAALLSEYNRRKNDVSSVEVMLSSDLKKDCIRKFDIVSYVPNRKDPLNLVKQKIYEGIHNLRDEGKFYLSAEIERADKIVDFLEDFGEVSEVVKNGSKLLEVTDIEKVRRNRLIRERNIQHSIKGEKCNFKTIKGTFSEAGLQKTELLARELDGKDEEKLLDFQSSFGSLGVFASKLYGFEPFFVNRNCYMTDYAEINCGLNAIEDFEALTEDGTENFDLAEFDVIGYVVDEGTSRKIVEQDIHDCRKALKSGGKIYVVHSKEFDVEGVLNKVFGNSTAQRRSIGYQVSVSEK